MNAILEQLNRIRGIGGSLVLNADGLPMASLLREGVDEDGLSAILATAFERIKRMCEGVNVGKPKIVNLQSAEGALVIMATGDNYLAILVDPQANLALLELETRPFLDAIKKKLSL